MIRLIHFPQLIAAGTKGANEFSFAIKNLNSMIPAVGDVDLSFVIQSDSLWVTKLTGRGTFFSKALQECSVLIINLDAVIEIVGDDDFSVARKGQSGWGARRVLSAEATLELQGRRGIQGDLWVDVGCVLWVLCASFVSPHLTIVKIKIQASGEPPVAIELSRGKQSLRVAESDVAIHYNHSFKMDCRVG